MKSRFQIWKFLAGVNFVYLAFFVMVFQVYAQNGPIKNSSLLRQNFFYNGYPTWSPDGRFIAFASNRSGNEDIWIMTAQGSGLLNLTSDSLASDIHPQWSPDGRFIAFISDRSGNEDIWIMGTDGSNPINLNLGNKGVDRNPQWSPDGRFIAFISEDINRVNSTISIIEIADFNLVTLTSSGNNVYGDLSWSPDGSSIVVTKTTIDASVQKFEDITNDDQIKPSGIDVFTLNPTGSINLFSDKQISQVSWSPIEDYITFVTLQNGEFGLNSDVWITQNNGLNAVNLTEDNDFPDTAPDWSPDGSLMAFVSMKNNKPGIYIYDMNKSDAINLTANLSGLIGQPLWSPDGTKIAFTLDEGLGPNIWIINSDGANPVNLTGQ